MTQHFHFRINAAGATRDGKPNTSYEYRVACQKCMDSYQRDWAGGPCHWRLHRQATDSSDGPNCFNGFDENNKINTHPKNKDNCRDALYIDPDTGITIFEEPGM